MANFNTKSVNPTKTVNEAGGEAFLESPILELISILLTSFAQDSFYTNHKQTFDRLNNVLALVSPEDAAKAAIYARNEFGMRSITHMMASEIAKSVSGKEWGKRFYAKVIHRPDDMTEILAYHVGHKQKVTNAMKKGFAEAFNKFDGYQLAKYRGEGKSMKLIDVVNLCHPLPSEKNAEALKGLVEGTLRSTETWEAKISAAGKSEDINAKATAWKEQVLSGKLGYFALLRNLRNILKECPEVIDEVCAQLTNPKAIKKSLVLPFRFTTALDELAKEHFADSAAARKVFTAIDTAINISCSNVPKMSGKTLVVVDISGSMIGRPAQIAALFAATMLKSDNDIDVVTFNYSARYVDVYNTSDSIMTLTKMIPFTGGGTNFHSIFPILNKAYERIIILSDMQGWIGRDCPKVEFNAYCSKFGIRPHIYSWDLEGHGTLQFPEKQVYALAGFSDKVFDLMGVLETDRNALINKIRSVEL